MSQKAFQWNKLASTNTKSLIYDQLFKSFTKDLLLSIENEIAYF